MKKTFLIPAALMIIAVTGCQQAQQLQNDATKAIDEASAQVESAKTQVIDAKNKLDEKVTQAQEAADAIKKLGE
jgi:outer membrane lipoprotein SlyB